MMCTSTVHEWHAMNPLTCTVHCVLYDIIHILMRYFLLSLLFPPPRYGRMADDLSVARAAAVAACPDTNGAVGGGGGGGGGGEPPDLLLADAAEMTRRFFQVPENGTAGPLRMAFTNFVFRQLSGKNHRFSYEQPTLPTLNMPFRKYTMYINIGVTSILVCSSCLC